MGCSGAITEECFGNNSISGLSGDTSLMKKQALEDSYSVSYGILPVSWTIFASKQYLCDVMHVRLYTNTLANSLLAV